MSPRKVDLSPREEGLIRQTFSSPPVNISERLWSFRATRAGEYVDAVLRRLPQGERQSIQWDNRRRT